MIDHALHRVVLHTERECNQNARFHMPQVPGMGRKPWASPVVEERKDHAALAQCVRVLCRCMRVSVVSAATRRDDPSRHFSRPTVVRRPRAAPRFTAHTRHGCPTAVFFGPHPAGNRNTNKHARAYSIFDRSEPGFSSPRAYSAVSGAMVPVRAAIGAYKIVFVQAKPEARRALTLATRLTFCPPACPCHPPPCRPPSRSPCRRPSPWPSPCRPRRPSPA